ncbi:uncharacterized protein LOC125231576 [Leguminivora glycinivorella]|uniref:uncharacterized protein LOC125231576 n=1 Tax=Leguminivora glycinivorella TaxID=1035111 RepID=UPI00200DA7BD|nr:uncharacterized protein LOC125231576 [Leguminivora glycinivorella]
MRVPWSGLLESAVVKGKRSEPSALSQRKRRQHRPALIKIGLEVPIVNSLPKPRWNMTKANWEAYKHQVDANVRWLKPEAANYNRFCGIVIGAAKRCIPRGFRKEYIPGWSSEIEAKYQKYLKNNDATTANDLLAALGEARREKWMNSVEGMSFTHSSRKSWALLRKLGGGAGAPTNTSTAAVHPDNIATRLKNITKSAHVDKAFAKTIRHENKALLDSRNRCETFDSPFSTDEVSQSLKYVKCGKAAGLDDMYPEFLTHLGKRAVRWLTDFFNNIFETATLPTMFMKSKVIAILKPGKTPDDPANFRPISLLSVTFKLLERILYNRIKDEVDKHIPAEQAGFRAGRSCCDQVLALSSHIEAGFQRGQKTLAAFVDLSAAYDTVWVSGLIHKMGKIIPSAKILRLLGNMMGPRKITVLLGDKASKYKLLKNGLPQGSVLAPLLFNVYTSDMPPTQSRKFLYADDIALTTQTKSFEAGEAVLTQDLNTLQQYYSKWRLYPNPSKSEVAAFHLTNCLADRQVDVTFCGQKIRHNSNPKYLGVTLDRSLTYRAHMETLSQKVKTRVNLISKLAGTSWGARADVLRTSSMALVYSPAEYCAPVWYKSAHTGKVDVQLNRVMRTISGSLLPTPSRWLPVLSHIAPPDIRRTQAAARKWHKASTYALPIRETLNHLPQARLPSRKPIWSDHQLQGQEPFNVSAEWRKQWQAHDGDPNIDPTNLPAGFRDQRKIWVTINRIRTGVGRSNENLYRWGISPSPACDCGEPIQTIAHITEECPERRFPGNMQDLLAITPEARDWLLKLDVKL